MDQHINKTRNFSGTRRCAAVIPLFLSLACGDTVDVLQPLGGKGGLSLDDHSAPDAGLPEEEGPVLPEEGTGSACTEGPVDGRYAGGLETFSRCSGRFYTCDRLLLLSDITLLGCDETGLLGDPAVVVSTPEEAFEAGSGASCEGYGRATRRTADTCCIEMAECTGLYSVAARVCVPDCEQVSLHGDGTVQSCADLSERKPPNYRQEITPASVGRACSGDFVCSSNGEEGADGSNSWGHVYFCGDGKVQLITLGPNGLPQGFGGGSD